MLRLFARFCCCVETELTPLPTTTEDGPPTEDPGYPTTPTFEVDEDEDEEAFEDPVKLNCGLFALIVETSKKLKDPKDKCTLIAMDETVCGMKDFRAE